MMDKLSKNSSQLELLREFLGLQKDMIVLMLSMLEGTLVYFPILLMERFTLILLRQCLKRSNRKTNG